MVKVVHLHGRWLGNGYRVPRFEGRLLIRSNSSPVRAPFCPSFPYLLTHFVFTRDSPYPEVRAAVANTDDPTMIVNTFRV